MATTTELAKRYGVLEKTAPFSAAHFFVVAAEDRMVSLKVTCGLCTMFNTCAESGRTYDKPRIQ